MQVFTKRKYKSEMKCKVPIFSSQLKKREYVPNVQGIQIHMRQKSNKNFAPKIIQSPELGGDLFGKQNSFTSCPLRNQDALYVFTFSIYDDRALKNDLDLLNWSIAWDSLSHSVCELSFQLITFPKGVTWGGMELPIFRILVGGLWVTHKS